MKNPTKKCGEEYKYRKFKYRKCEEHETVKNLKTLKKKHK